MNYRGFFYFFITAVFLFSVFFSEAVLFGNYEKQKIAALQKIQTLKNQPSKELVETFIELEKPDNPKFESNLTSRDSGKLTEEKGFVYYNDDRVFEKEETKTPGEKKPEGETGEKSSDTTQLTIHQPDEKNQKSKIDFIPNRYTREKTVIHLSSNGMIGISTEKNEFAQYLMETAKKIFYNWVEFIPAMQINDNLIKRDKNGEISGTVGIYFEEDMTYSVLLSEPYISDTMNALTLRSFQYLTLPAPPEKMKMNLILVRFTITLGMRAEAEFKFDYLKEKQD
ncbi:MAG TPA: hypothetical protein DHW82_05535 [Spirochaetia bacterium]|nr:MAG: hypothetical protein A2Y41_07490 [Spirochaetes bacterium GWB1_36_13]HCL56455.1 hypothetical protein [Spirochaetia bacterium]